ncbi:hypothetical protein FXW78_25950 [Rhodococcus opacus]|nr:hypothetical protein [Rhodococcus opacus]
MEEDLDASWSWLLPEQQRILRENPSGPVPKELVPRLHEYGLLGVGTKYVTSPTGVRQTFLADRAVSYIEGLPLPA